MQNLNLKFVIILSIILFFLIVFLIHMNIADAATVPYRIRMAASTYTAQLKGVSGTRTTGLTIQGTYSSTFKAHEFTITIAGYYDLWYDAAGGSNYAKDAAWSGANGKFVSTGYFDDAIDSDLDYRVDAIDDSVVGRSNLTTTVNVLLNNPGSGIAHPPDDVGLEFKISGPDTSVGIKDSYLNSAIGDSSTYDEIFGRSSGVDADSILIEAGLWDFTKGMKRVDLTQFEGVTNDCTEVSGVDLMAAFKWCADNNYIVLLPPGKYLWEEGYTWTMFPGQVVMGVPGQSIIYHNYGVAGAEADSAQFGLYVNSGLGGFSSDSTENNYYIYGITVQGQRKKEDDWTTGEGGISITRWYDYNPNRVVIENCQVISVGSEAIKVTGAREAWIINCSVRNTAFTAYTMSNDNTWMIGNYAEDFYTGMESLITDEWGDTDFPGTFRFIGNTFNVKSDYGIRTGSGGYYEISNNVFQGPDSTTVWNSTFSIGRWTQISGNLYKTNVIRDENESRSFNGKPRVVYFNSLNGVEKTSYSDVNSDKKWFYSKDYTDITGASDTLYVHTTDTSTVTSLHGSGFPSYGIEITAQLTGNTPIDTSYQGLNIFGNTFSNMRKAVQFYTGTVYTPLDFVNFTGNYLIDCGASAISLVGNIDSIATSSIPPEHIEIKGNTIDNWYTDTSGSSSYASGSAILIRAMGSVIIKNNTFHRNSAESFGRPDPLFVGETDYCLFADNIINYTGNIHVNVDSAMWEDGEFEVYGNRGLSGHIGNDWGPVRLFDIPTSVSVVTGYGYQAWTVESKDLRIGEGLRLSNSKTMGDESFTTSALLDTVLILGALATDFYFVISHDTSDYVNLKVAKADTVIFQRKVGGKSGLVYDWLRIIR